MRIHAGARMGVKAATAKLNPEPPKSIPKKCPRCGVGEHFVPNPVWLRWRRQKAGLSLEMTSAKLGYSATYIGDVELGKRPVPEKLLQFYKSLRPA